MIPASPPCMLATHRSDWIFRFPFRSLLWCYSIDSVLLRLTPVPKMVVSLVARPCIRWYIIESFFPQLFRSTADWKKRRLQFPFISIIFVELPSPEDPCILCTRWLRNTFQRNIHYFCRQSNCNIWNFPNASEMLVRVMPRAQSIQIRLLHFDRHRSDISQNQRNRWGRPMIHWLLIVCRLVLPQRFYGLLLDALHWIRWDIFG